MLPNKNQCDCFVTNHTSFVKSAPKEVSASACDWNELREIVRVCFSTGHNGQCDEQERRL